MALPAYADGTLGAHAVRYTPSRWAQITPWPKALAPTSESGGAAVSRAEVASSVADALKREAFREALVATYVWGKGKRGVPGGSGPAALRKILDFDGLDAALAAAVTALREHGAAEAYAALRGQVPGLGPAFFTKFLYFTGFAVPPARGPRPLIQCFSTTPTVTPSGRALTMAFAIRPPHYENGCGPGLTAATSGVKSCNCSYEQA
ncbi:hypothetical protein ACPCIZ_32745 [Streptomyces cellulosae]|nr:hypothetical protein OG692_33625 [Streptomyces cellulosae]